MTAPPCELASPRRVGEQSALAKVLEGLATASSAAPAVFAFAYAIAWFFSIKNFLLISGHLSVMIAAGLLIEGGNRLSHHKAAKGPAQAAESLGLVGAVLLIYALLPMARVLLASDAVVFEAIESADPQARLAQVMILAYAALAGGLGALVLGLARVGHELGEPTRGLNQALFVTMVAAALASLLHVGYGYMEPMRELRHLFAALLVLAGAMSVRTLRPVLLRVAAGLRHRDAQAQF